MFSKTLIAGLASLALVNGAPKSDFLTMTSDIKGKLHASLMLGAQQVEIFSDKPVGVDFEALDVEEGEGHVEAASIVETIYTDANCAVEPTGKKTIPTGKCIKSTTPGLWLNYTCGGEVIYEDSYSDANCTQDHRRFIGNSGW